MKLKRDFYTREDVVQIAQELLGKVLFTKMKYWGIKGFDTTVVSQDYQRVLSIAKANDKGAPNLSFAPYPSKVLIGYANIPDTGYGS